MDSLTHALIIAIPLTLFGRPDLAVYGIMGAVLIDLDILFGMLPGYDPRLYIFTHGGFTHSFFGAFMVTLVVAAASFIISSSAPAMMAPFGPLAAIAIAAGALTHIAADYLAYPGIPLFYPVSDKKYTLGIMGGPSAFIMLASLVYIAAMALGLGGIGNPWPYIAFFGLVIVFCTGAKAWAAANVKGRTVATMNPLRWMVIEDQPDAYRFYVYDFFKGASPSEIYEKYRGLAPEEAMRNERKPEVRRLKYNSYVVTVEKKDGVITFMDPIREKGYIWYPPNYKNYRFNTN